MLLVALMRKSRNVDRVLTCRIKSDGGEADVGRDMGWGVKTPHSIYINSMLSEEAYAWVCLSRNDASD